MKTSLSFIFMTLLFASDAFAAPLFDCFYGGWPTLKNAQGKCQQPFKQEIIDAQTGENAPFKYTRCRIVDPANPDDDSAYPFPTETYRCNPVVFGQANPHRDQPVGRTITPYAWSAILFVNTANPETGNCVNAPVSGLLQACLIATYPNIANMAKTIKANPANFNRMADSVEAYCKLPSSVNLPMCLTNEFGLFGRIRALRAELLK